ncbi:MAG TPA: hypothetical protein VLH40_05760 [Atribacteraceae bacterium]|nr:hypothetical protein [Atribacteraceae bacterium]
MISIGRAEIPDQDGEARSSLKKPVHGQAGIGWIDDSEHEAALQRCTLA